MPLTLDGTNGVSAVQAGAVESGDLPAGSVIQVVSTTKNDTFSVVSGLGENKEISGLNVSITPVSSSSKILIFGSVSVGGDGNAELSGTGFSFLRNGSKISDAVGATAGSRNLITVQAGRSDVQNDRGMANPSSQFLDSPSTTSTITYSIALACTFGGNVTLYVNRSDDDPGADGRGQRATSTITAMEIKG